MFCPSAEQMTTGFHQSERSPLLVNCNSLIAPDALTCDVTCDSRCRLFKWTLKCQAEKKKSVGEGDGGGDGGMGAAQKIPPAHKGAHVVCLYDGSCEQASCASSS